MPLTTERGYQMLVQLTDAPTGLASSSRLADRQAVALGDSGGDGHDKNDVAGGSGGGSGGLSDEDALQARLDALRRG